MKAKCELIYQENSEFIFAPDSEMEPINKVAIASISVFRMSSKLYGEPFHAYYYRLNYHIKKDGEITRPTTENFSRTDTEFQSHNSDAVKLAQDVLTKKLADIVEYELIPF